MANELRGKRVAAVVEQGFEQVELTEPRKALEAAGATVDVVSPQSGSVKGWQHTRWGDEVAVDRPLSEARPEDYDALLLPGGVMNPDMIEEFAAMEY
jgi:protease I